MDKETILSDICQKNGCLWVNIIKVPNPPEGFPPQGHLYCARRVDPTQVITPKGCSSADIAGPWMARQGGDIRSGVMRETGFTENTGQQ